MGGRLAAASVGKPDLTAKQQTVLTAMCKIADDAHGRFWKHPAAFLRDDVPRVASRTALRNHQASLQAKGYIGRVRNGNGKPSASRQTRKPDPREPLGPSHCTEYQILEPEVVGYEWIAGYEAINAQRPAPIQRRMPGLPSVPSDKSDIQDARVSAPPDIQDARVSAPPDIQSDAPYYMNTKDMNTKAANTNDVAAASGPSFFVELANACAERGIRGVRPDLFNDLRPKLAQCPVQLGLQQAEWCADEIMYANRRGRIRNPTGQLIHIVKRVVETGDTGVYIEDSDVINF